MSKKRKNLKDEVEPLDYGGSCSVLFPLRSHIRRPSAGTALSMVDGKTHKIPEKKTPSQPNSNLQELTLIEQLEEIKKDYQVNFNKEVANLRQEKKQIQLELDILYKSFRKIVNMFVKFFKNKKCCKNWKKNLFFSSVWSM